MAIKELKTRKQFTSTLKNELFDKIRDYSEKSGIPLSKVLDRAVEEYLKSNAK